MALPLALRAGVQTSESPRPMVVVPATTATPFLVSVPLETAWTRNPMA